MQNIEGKQERIYKKGEILFKQDEQAAEMFIVQSGQLKIYRTDKNGNQLDLGVYKKGSIIGEISLFDNSPRFATVEADTDCRVIYVGKEQFSKQLEKVPQWLATIINIIIKRLRNTSLRVQDSTPRDISASVARILSYIFAKHKERIAGEESIGMPLANKEITDILGIDIDTLSATYDVLIKKGIIRIEKGKVLLPEPDMLDKYVRYKQGAAAAAAGTELDESAQKLLNSFTFFAEKQGRKTDRGLEFRFRDFSDEYEKMTGQPYQESDVLELARAGLIQLEAGGDQDEGLDSKQVIIDQEKVKQVLEIQQLAKKFD